MNAQTLITQAKTAGVTLRLVDGKIKAKGQADAVALIVDELRANKSHLILWLTELAANDSEPIIEAATEPGEWRGLAVAYHQHHFQCATCQACGMGVQYGGRCAVGASLWLKYTEADDFQVTKAETFQHYATAAATEGTTPDDSV